MQAGDVSIKLMADIADVQRKFAAMQQLAQQTGQSIGNAFNGIGAKIAGALSVGALGAWVKSAIDAADETSKLAQKVGVATKDIAGLQLAFRQSGASDAFAGSMAKLSKAIAEGNKGLDAMGIKTNDADGSLKSTRQVLGEVADKFAGYADGAAKSALAQELFGKSGAELIPLLNGGAQALADYDAMAAKLGLTLDEETTKNAEKFNDTLDLIGQGATGVGRQIAAQLLPTLTGLADQFFTSMTEGDRLKKTADFLASALKGLYIAGLSIVELFTTVGKVLGGVGAAIVAALTGDFSGATAILKDMSQDVGQGWKDTLTQIQGAWTATGSSAVEAMAQTQKAVKQTTPVIKGLEDQAKAAAKALKDEQDLRIKIGRDWAAEQNDRVNKENEEYQKALADQLEAEKQARMKFGREQVTRESDEREARNKAEADALAKQLDNAEKAYQKSYDTIERTLTDALMRGFESGKGFFDSMWDTIKNTLKSTVLKVFLQPVTGALAGLGMPGMASAGQGALGGAGGMGTSSMLQGLTGIYNGIKTGFASIGDSIAFAAQDAGAWLMQNTTGALNKFGGQLMQQSGALGTAAGYAGGMAAGVFAGRAISGEFGSNATVNIGTIAGAVLGGPIGAAIGGAVGGLLNRAFGMGNKQVQSQGITGTFGGDGFAGSNYADMFQKGGWFRSDKRWTQNTALDNTTSQALSTGFVQIKQATAAMAASLGLGATAIANYSQIIKLALTNDAAQNQKLITDLFTSMGDTLATRVAPALATFAKDGETASTTMQRLSTSLTSVNQTLDTLGQRSLSLSLAGGNAASKLADLFGGLQNFGTLTSQYYQAFYSDAERMATTARQLGTAFAAANIAMPEGLQQYRALVDAQNLNTEAGRQTYATLMTLAPAFAEVTKASDAAAEAAQKEADAKIEALRASGKSISEWLAKLRGSASDAAGLQSSRSGYLTTLNLARANDTGALGDITGAADQYLAAAMASATSTAQYRAIAAQVGAEVSALPAVRGFEAEMLAKLTAVNDSIGLVGDYTSGTQTNTLDAYTAATKQIQALVHLNNDGLYAVSSNTASSLTYLAAMQGYLANIDKSTAKTAATPATSASGGGGGGLISKVLGWLFADGDVFGGPGIYSKPTQFQFAGGQLGVMGEAGPEAVMPLERMADGALGVRSTTQYVMQRPGNSAQDNTALVAELRALRAEVADLRTETRTTAANTGKTSRLLERVTQNGEAMQTVAA